ncbi:MAG: hypothetical protein CME06_16485 [Gemmatimonadetes bacterium]|nr:hypothetical protein [Gemmatimonadota bacterium]
MTLRGAILVAAAAALTAGANVLLRAGILRFGELSLTLRELPPAMVAFARQPLFVAGTFLYAAAAIVWFSAISIEELSTSYPVLVGMTFVLVTACAVPIFGESFSVPKGLGIVVILLGVVLVARA